MTIPSDDVRWATGATAEITNPPSTRKDVGFRDNDVPPHEYVNWMWNRLAAWVDHLKGAGNYSTLEEAIEDLTDVSGDPIERTCIVDEQDFGREPGVVLSKIDAADPVDVDVTGEVVVVVDGATGNGAAYRRSLAGGVIQTYTTPVAPLGGRVPSIATDGRKVVIGLNNTVFCFDIGTDAVEWTYNHAIDVNDVCLDGEFVYLVGDESGGAGGPTCRSIDIATGALVWQYNHGAELYSVATTGRAVIVGGLPSAFASAATLRGLRADNGADFNNEGGTGADTTGVAFDSTGTRDSVVNVATDGRAVWTVEVFGAGPAHSLHAYGLQGIATGAVFNLGAAAGAVYTSLAVDHEYVCATYADPATPDYRLVVCDKTTLGNRWQTANYASGIGPFDEVPRAVATDGCAVFVVTDAGATNWTLYRFTRGNRARLWKRIDPATPYRYLPYRQLIIPEEG